ncbi:phosphatase PAP2 family protein [Gordonia polyisoprenivorans]|uniref:Phosphatase PAP2 family protein n=1 Tax=Gordonia polyisoprenivorans TaxID=84595 RepID=A0A846WKM6_9ACTN|nr:phosphatase PAP2 family protein [Gordonia polyisoprenivorans]
MMAMSLRVRSVLLSMFAVLLMLGAPVAHAAPAPATAPAGFSTAQLVGPFASDVPPGGTYLPELDGFAALRAQRPDLMKQNLAKVVSVNNSATPAQQADAVAINYDDRIVSLSQALGTKVGTAFRQLLAAGKLPKVAQLVKGDTARAGIPLQTTLIEKQYYNNPRPFVVAPAQIKRYNRPGSDLYGDLAGNGSYPSGHSSQAFWQGALLAYWLPEAGPQILAQSGHIGLSRMVLGVHYPLDVMGGRIMGLTVASERLSDPAFARLVDAAGDQLREQLRTALGEPVARALADDPTVASTSQAVSNAQELMTFGFPRISPNQVNAIPAQAAALLRSRFPHLSDAARLDILRRTAIPAGYPLDQAGVNGGWVRIDLAAAYAVSG